MSATPHDPMWDAADGAERRAYFGHRDERDVPGYCTCGELCRACPEKPRNWYAGWGSSHWPGDGCKPPDARADVLAGEGER